MAPVHCTPYHCQEKWVSMIDVELVNVTKRFGKIVAVDNVSLTVQRGEFLTLLGPSGCGKTTTMRVIAGLEKPTAGAIHICGEDVTYTPPYRRDASLMFQNYALFPHKTVFDNVAFGLKYGKVPKQERQKLVSEALALVRLPGIESRYPRQLSGGQQQRVALARALVVRPAVLLLDEPLSNLDRKLRERMQVELKQIQEEVGITFIFVTHDQQEALTLSDRIAVMNQGAIEQVGTPLEIYEKPQSRFVAEFVGQSNLLEGQVTNNNSSGATFETTGGLTIHIPAVGNLTGQGELALHLRAERVQLHRTQPDVELQNAISATVEHSLFVGNMVQYLLRLPGDDILLATQPSTGEAPLVHGTQVWAAFTPDDCLLLRG